VISLEAVAYSSYCNTVEWFWWDWSLSQWPTGFLQWFDAVGWAIWPVKIVLEMTYKVSSGTLSLYSLIHSPPLYHSRTMVFVPWVWTMAFKDSSVNWPTFCTAWRTGLRHIWNIPSSNHSNEVHVLSDNLPIFDEFFYLNIRGKGRKPLTCR